jgi:caffeoyl-CoA O-methyltransferase
MIRTNGVIVVDNTLSHGRVADPEITEDNLEGIRRFNDYARDDGRVELVLLPIGDGVTLARKR